MIDKIKCMVGDEERIIGMDVFMEAHTRLADFYRALGLEGDRLDLAIVEEMPHRLAQLLGAANTTQH
jgi:hypothetical protein